EFVLSRHPRACPAGPKDCRDEPGNDEWFGGLVGAIAEAPHLVEILPLDAQELGRAVAARRMEIALVVEMRHAGLQRVVAGEAHLAHLASAGRFDQRPVAHHRFSRNLAVDRPGRPVIMRLARARVMIGVSADAEAELRVLVDDVALAGTGPEMRGDESRV